MELKRFKDIIAIKTYDSVTRNDTIVGFHSSNLEVAELSQESFNEMTPVSVKVGSIPTDKDAIDADAYQALTDWNSETNLDAKSGKIDFGIRSITINVNQICNLKCAYCAAGGDGTYGEPTNQISVEKTLPQLKYFLSSLKPGSRFSIVFVGGEPLLHPQAIRALYEYVITESEKFKIAPIFSIVTNGTLLKGITLDIVRSMRLYLTISIDATKEVNDVVRPTKNGSSSTDMTLSGIAELTKDRGELLSIGFASVHSSSNEDLLSNYKFLDSLQPDWIEFNYSYAEKSEFTLKNYIEQMSQIAEIAWQKGGETELRKIKNFDEYFQRLDSQRRVENHCGAGKSYLMVDSKNKLYTCPWVVGDKNEVVGENELLNHDKLAKYSKSLIELNNCNSCWAKFVCGGGCMYINKVHTGDKHTKDIIFCERTRSLILIALLYYKRARIADL